MDRPDVAARRTTLPRLLPNRRQAPSVVLAGRRMSAERGQSRDFEKVPVLRQRQDSLEEQMKTVVVAAERLGCYDAADWLRDRWAER